MKHCKKPRCKLAVWRRGLCFTHWKLSEGYIFDLARKVFVRAPEDLLTNERELVTHHFCQ